MAEEIRLDVVSVAHSRGLRDAAGDLQGLSAEADKTAKGFHRARDETFNLDHAIADARVEIARLNDEFKRTGDTTLFRSMRRQRSELNQLLKVASEGVSEGGSAAIDFGGRGLRPRNALIGVVAGSLAILSPMIGAAIAGAVTGAVGVGGLAGGIATAAKDPAVKSAAKAFGADISKEFFSGGGQFVQPVIDSLGVLKREFEAMDVGAIFGKTAPFVVDFAEGLAGGLREFGESFSRVLDRSGEIIPVVAQGLVRLGDGLGSMIEEMAASEGTISGIRFLFEALAETAHAVGVTVKWLGDRFAEIGRFSAGLSGALEDIATALPGVEGDNIFSRINDQIEGVMGTGDGFVHTLTKVQNGLTSTGEAARSGSLVPYAGQVEIVRKHQEQLNEEMQKTISIMLAQDNATLGLQQAMLDLGDQLKNNKGKWDTTTQAGLDNRRALLSAVEAAERKRQADIASGKSADEANAAYNRTIRKLEDMARKAGISEKALRDLVGDYKVTVHYKTVGSFYVPPKAILEAKGRATGGPVGPGTYIVGERGPEVLQLGQGSRGHVYPSVTAYAGGAGPVAGGGRSYTINVYVAPGADMREAGRRTVEVIQAYERANGSTWRS